MITKYLCIIEFIIILILSYCLIGNNDKFNKLKEDILIREDRIQIFKIESQKEREKSDSLKKELVKRMMIISNQEKSKTIIINKYEKEIENINSLNDTAAINFLSNRLSQADHNRE